MAGYGLMLQKIEEHTGKFFPILRKLAIITEKYDRLTNAINSFINLPDTRVDLLIKLLNQNKGKLSRRKRQKDFDELSDEEISLIEEYYVHIFEK